MAKNPPFRTALQLIRILAVFFGFAAFGCSRDNSPETSGFLLRIGATVLTEADFKRSFDVQKTVYGNSASDPELLKQLKRDIFRELVERALILERARETGIRVSPRELETAVRSIRRSYPPGEFEKALFTSAVSYQMWREELKARLIIHKLILRDIGIREIIPPEVADIDRNRHKRLQREIAEAAYPDWIGKLRGKYSVDFNEVALRRLINTQPSILSK
ncbi:SurA N-terminal domain-containing protein [Desulfococcus sp.]|uniref:SurA N-terminal domain-containing protein n=1 Tax=Desulfococcus sp. TaxID=2025834 RepID=UPI003592ED1E